MAPDARRLIGWRVRRKVGDCLQYATGLGRLLGKAWTEERGRAYLFTDTGTRRGLDDGRRWAEAHAAALEGPDWRKRGVRVIAVIVVTKRKAG